MKMSKTKKYTIFSCFALAALLLADSLYKKVVYMDAAHYSDSYNVSFKVAKYRLDIQKEIGDLNSFLIDNYKGSFSGLYIQHQPTYSVNVLLTNSNIVKDLEYFWTEKSWGKYVRTHRAEYTLDELELALRKLSQLISELNTSNRISLDIINNRVDLHVLEERIFEKMLTDKGVELPKAVRTLVVEEFKHDHDF